MFENIKQFSGFKSNRSLCALIHFVISLSCFSVLLFFLVNFWYPGLYFSNSGGWQGIRIVAGIDVVLGPLLTLIVFNPKKSTHELTIDIGLIATIQVIALLWGIYTLHNQRPVAVVFWGKNFMTVPAEALNEQAYNIDNLAGFSEESPPLIYAENPVKLDDLKKMMDMILKQQIPPHHQPRLYRPLKDRFSEIKPFQVNIDEILAKNSGVNDQLLPLLQKNNKNTHDVFYFLLQSKYRNGLLIFDADAQYLGGVTLD